MSSSNEPPGGPAGAGPGRPRPPTIDLKATEVPRDRAAGQAEPGAQASSWASGLRGHPALAWLPADFPWPLVAAGAGGAALMLAVLAMAGAFSGRDSGTAAADARVTRMEQQIRELAARPLPVAGDSKAVDDIAGRLGRLETIVATPKAPISDPALANRMATLEGEIKALGERIGVLGRRNDEIASIAGEARSRADQAVAAVAELKKAPAPAAPAIERKEVDALNTRIAALERAAKAMEAQLAGRTGCDGADRSLRLVVVASTLNAAVERGAPFAAELAAAKAAAPDPKSLAPLEPFAPSGVPTAAVLTRELTALMPAVAKAVGTTSRGGGILDRLKAGAERLVQVGPIDGVPGDDPAAIVRRIEIQAEQGNLNGAMAEIAKLPEGAHALTKEWVAKVEARNIAIEASRRFAAGALASLSKPSL
ncbi:MAG: hypothetical protein K2Y71_06315 [Xanthobacteraceae bacterium]|nr:hypothetical protein [Xanthobacteraceae bacterium]